MSKVQQEIQIPVESPHQEVEEQDTKKWGTQIMGAPAVPTIHADNQRAALWAGGEQPYIVVSPDKPAGNPLDALRCNFHSWTTKAETLARSVWHNLYTAPSMAEAAWGKANLTAKAIMEGGFESIFRQMFETHPGEQLKKTFACYLSTTTGPVAGTLYLSTARVAFSSDRPLYFSAPSGQVVWSYYKVTIPWGNVGSVSPITMREDPAEKYIQVVTIDGHAFWFMGFVNFEKASNHLSSRLREFNDFAGNSLHWQGA